MTKRKITNDGQLPQYFVESSHPAIIEQHIFDAVQERMKKQREQFTAPQSTVASYPFTSKIQCSCCGRNYRRKKTHTNIVWICATYNTKGKKYCPTAKQIPENTLIDLSCEILGIQEFDADILEQQIDQILVPKPNELIFLFHDGHTISAHWKDRSRSESWTEEMRQKAKEDARKCRP